MTTQTPTPNEAFVTSLRQVADFFEAHPELPVDRKLDITMFLTGVKETAELAQMVAKSLGTFAKVYDDEFFRLNKSFGVLTLRYIFYRNDVCVRRVIGTKTATRVIPVENAPDAPTEEYQEDIVEWNCPVLLGDEGTDATPTDPVADLSDDDIPF